MISANLFIDFMIDTLGFHQCKRPLLLVKLQYNKKFAKIGYCFKLSSNKKQLFSYTKNYKVDKRRLFYITHFYLMSHFYANVFVLIDHLKLIPKQSTY